MFFGRFTSKLHGIRIFVGFSSNAIFNSSQSTLHIDMTERLAAIVPVLWEKLKAVLS